MVAACDQVISIKSNTLPSSAAFPYWYQQLNRNLGRLGAAQQWCAQPPEADGHRGSPACQALKGRGAILVRFGEGPEALVVVMMHLALGGRTFATCNWPTCAS
ncbi:hypothetical protein RHM66_09735 [Pseudomonas sp. RTB3]|nr:hypothetical protein RHM66_09735 [Pseudomonas sp. RTB3]